LRIADLKAQLEEVLKADGGLDGAGAATATAFSFYSPRRRQKPALAETWSLPVVMEAFLC
jgi:hypothetical protein